MPVTTPHNPLTVLRHLVDAYDALQATDGARVYLDAESSRTFTAGQWLGGRMAGLVDQARVMLDDFDFASKDREIAVCLVDESGATVGEWTEEGFATPLAGGDDGQDEDGDDGHPLDDYAQEPDGENVTLVCSVCGNKASGTIDKLADDGWIPEYWIDAETSDGPACPGCLQHRIGPDKESGELYLKPKEEWTR